MANGWAKSPEAAQEAAESLIAMQDRINEMSANIAGSTSSHGLPVTVTPSLADEAIGTLGGIPVVIHHNALEPRATARLLTRGEEWSPDFGDWTMFSQPTPQGEFVARWLKEYDEMPPKPPRFYFNTGVQLPEVGSITCKVTPDLAAFKGALAPEGNSLDGVKLADVLRHTMYSGVDDNHLDYTPFFTRRGAYVTVEDATEGRSRVFRVSITEVE